jgi:hypothetical protein
MYCSSCGKQMDHIRMRCPACHHMTAAYWLNAYSLGLLLLIVAANYFYLVYLLPYWQNFMAALEVDLPLPMRLHAALARWVTDFGWLVALLLILLLGILRWQRKTLPGFLKSGKLLASLTWLVMVGTLGTLLMALVFTSVVIPDRTAGGALRSYRMRSNHLSALDSMREIRTAETAYLQKNRRLGYTCKLADLKPFAAPIRYQGKGYTDLLFTGRRDGYSFTLEGCTSKPATYRVAAVPAEQWTSGRFVFCSDQSGAVHYSDETTAQDCWKKRTPVY